MMTRWQKVLTIPAVLIFITLLGLIWYWGEKLKYYMYDKLGILP